MADEKEQLILVIRDASIKQEQFAGSAMNTEAGTVRWISDEHGNRNNPVFRKNAESVRNKNQ